jgi:hypothetical protein
MDKAKRKKKCILHSTQAYKTTAVLFTVKECVCCCCPVTVHVKSPDPDAFAQLITPLFNNDG